tara:strand:+ start:496 stop:696 length:201 start_codon:yes stop_codon:yes gene_type:complete
MSKEQKYIGFHNIDTYQTYRNETYIGGINSDGENITLVFNTIELLEWLDFDHMKKESIKYIKELNK